MHTSIPDLCPSNPDNECLGIFTSVDLSKDDLRRARLISQVDSKFIACAIPTSGLLFLVDQVEALSLSIIAHNYLMLAIEACCSRKDPQRVHACQYDHAYSQHYHFSSDINVTMRAAHEIRTSTSAVAV